MKRILPVLAFAVFLAGCPSSSYHRAVVAEHDSKSIVQAFQQAEIIEFKNGRISPAEHRAIESEVEKIGLAGQALTSALQNNAPNATVLADLQGLTQAVGDLGNTGVLGLKNETSKATLTAVVNALKAVLANLQVILAAPATETTGGKS